MTDENPTLEPGTDEIVEARKPRRGILIGARVAAGSIGVIVAAVAVAAAGLLPLPTFSAQPASVLVSPVPTAQELVCAGGLLRLGDETGQDATTATSIGSPSVTSAASSGDVVTDTLDGPGGQAAPRSIRSAPNESADADAVLLAGSQSQVAASGEFGGLAAAECAGVSTDTWLAGGATTVGRTTLLTISNPSEVVATVALAISGEDGPIDAPGLTGIIVQPHAQRVIPLAGLAPDTVSPVIHVTSQGGQVVANLQQSTVRGLEAGGVDLIGATARPSRELVIPGVVISNSESVGGRLGESGFADLITVLRVFVPGSDNTSVTVTLVPDDPEAVDVVFTYDLAGSTVEDLPIEELVDGSYTVTISADDPVVAAMRVSTVADQPSIGGAQASDFAWLGAATRVTSDTLVAVAGGPSPVLHVNNPTAEAVTVTIEAAQGAGADLSLDVPARSTATTPVVANTTYRLSGFASIYASVTLVGEGQLAGYSVQPPALTSSDITVYP